MIRPSTPSEEPLQAQQTEGSPTKAGESSEQPGGEGAKETNVYAAAADTQVGERFAGIPERVYVPNVGRFSVGHNGVYR